MWKTLAAALQGQGKPVEQVAQVLTQYGASGEEAAQIAGEAASE